jgi:uroporphyrinogen decarboxylase
MSGLTSRERVTAALDHREPDRVPIDVGGSRVSGISAIAYKNLLKALGRKEEIRLYDIKQQLAMVSLKVAEILGSDVVQLTRLSPTTGMSFFKIDRWEAGRLTDGSPCLVPEGYDPVLREDGSVEILHEGKLAARRPAGSLYFESATAPLEGAEIPEDIDAYTWPDPWSDRETDFLEEEIRRLYHGTDKALFAGLPLYDCSFLELGQTMFGFETLLTNFILKPDLMHHWLDRVLEHHLATLDRFLPLAAPYISAIQMNDDLGAQDSLLISPEIFRSFLKPRMAAWISFVRERCAAKIFLHCDGAISEIMDDLIEIGVQVLNPVQTGARGMEPEKLKKRYGDRLSFWGGGVETQTTLPFGSVQEVEKQVEERIRLFAPGGGYVFASIHNIQSDVSPEKIRAVYGTARRAGVYPLG